VDGGRTRTEAGGLNGGGAEAAAGVQVTQGRRPGWRRAGAAAGLDAALELQTGAVRPGGGRRADWDGGTGMAAGLERRPAGEPPLGGCGGPT
jgi:hypothetical protein